MPAHTNDTACMFMITLFTDFCNPISQDSYDKLISSLQFHQLSCSCGRAGCLNIHGYYSRSVKQGEGSVRLSFCRVRCSACSRTHALIPSFIVPYSQVSLPDQAEIILASEGLAPPGAVMERTTSIDENNVACVLRRYRLHWKQRLLSEALPILPLTQLLLCCFEAFHRQFLQIKCTPNLLFLNTT